ncbi:MULTISPECIES: barstar family protein [Psychrobacter]|uniref:barstar family protein n=1 Tax=Psychrobacter TaxID=497 RepID=UPI001918A613|nr:MULTISPECIES: barstar family protein [Psychrobacter]MDA5133860.1 barstar family protein [Psychrobacter sp. ANT_H3]
MSQAIYYVNENQINQSNINQNGVNRKSINQSDSALIDNIPEQALNIPIGDVLDKETLLTSLAKAANFPDYFAHNWDSAWDCLTDSDITHLTLYLNGVEKINTEDFNVFKRLIEDAYKDFGKPQLWIVAASDDACE